METVLRAENGADLDPAGRGPIHDVPECAVYGRGIADEPDRPALKELAVEEHIGTENNGHGLRKTVDQPFGEPVNAFEHGEGRHGEDAERESHGPGGRE